MITNLHSQPGSTQLIIQISQIWQWLTTRCQIISAGQIHFLSAAVLLCCTKKSALCTCATEGKECSILNTRQCILEYLLQGHLNTCWMEGPNLFIYSTPSLNSRTLNSGWGSTIIRKEQPFVFLLHGQLTVDIKMIFGIKNNLTTMMDFQLHCIWTYLMPTNTLKHSPGGYFWFPCFVICTRSSQLFSII